MIELIIACAPGVAPVTIQEIVRVESKGNPIAVNINKRDGISYQQPKKVKTVRDAIAVTHDAMKRGHTVDIGYMQLNSANLPRLGYTVKDAFDPCKNLAGGAKILNKAYMTEFAKHGNEQRALRSALSIYNTGNSKKGFSNGYVNRYLDGKPGQPTINPYTATTAVSFAGETHEQ
jgi:type IV secretion system protein VirB1